MLLHSHSHAQPPYASGGGLTLESRPAGEDPGGAVSGTFRGGSVTQGSGSSVRYREFEGDWWRVSDWIYWSFAGGDASRMKEQLRLFPLEFRERELELAFIRYLASSYISRCTSFSFISLACLTSFVVLTSFFFSLRVSDGQVSYVAPAAAPLAVPVFVLAFCTARIPKWKLSRARPELYTTLCLTFMAVLTSGVLLRFSLAMRRPFTLSSTMALKVWCDSWTFVLYAMYTMSLTAVFRIRISTVLFPTYFLGLCFILPLVVQVVMKVPPTAFVPAGVTAKYINAITAVQILVVGGIVNLALGAKFQQELNERLDFAKRQSRLRQVVALLSERKKRKKGSSLVEHLLELLDKARNVITVCMLKHQDSSVLADAIAVLDECLDCLRNTDELFAVHVGDAEGETGEYVRMYNIARPGAPQEMRDARDDMSSAERVVRALLDVPLAAEDAALKPPDSAALLRLMPDIGKKWKIDFLQLQAQVPRLVLHVGAVLLQPYITELQTTPETVYHFLQLADAKYADNPYHNSAHGAMVAHVAYFLATTIALFEHNSIDSWAYPAVIVAGLCHDVGHPGCNNAFLVNAHWKLAQLYNDSAVLENYHACLTFSMLAHAQTDVFARYSIESLREIRKRIVEMILATDMSQHFESLSRFRMRKLAADFSARDNLEDSWLVARMCVKTADLGHAMIDWATHVKWSLRVTEEFYRQGETEARLSLPISPLCDRNAHGDFAKSQKGFLEFVVMPLLRELEEVDHTDTVTGELTRGLVYNRFRWDELAAKGELVEIPEEVRNTPVHYDMPLKLLQSQFRGMVTHQSALVRQHAKAIEDARLKEAAAAAPSRLRSDARRGAIG